MHSFLISLSILIKEKKGQVELSFAAKSPPASLPSSRKEGTCRRGRQLYILSRSDLLAVFYLFFFLLENMGYATGLSLLWLGLPTVVTICVRLACFAMHKFIWSRLLAPAPYTSVYFTPVTLTEILRRNGCLPEGVRVTSMRYSAMTCGAVGEVKRLHLDYSSSDGSSLGLLPKTMVVKELGKVAKDIVLSALLDIVSAEVRAYSVLSDVAGDLQPKCFYHATSSFGRGVLLLEDLGHLKHKSSLSGATPDELKAMLRLAARLHSRTWGQAEKYFGQFHLQGELLDNMTPQNFKKAVGGPWKVFLQETPFLLRAMRAVSTFECDNSILTKFRGRPLNAPVRGQFPRPFGCLIHCDLRLDNCFFTDEGEVIPVDWQLVSYCHPLLDVCWPMLDLDSVHLGRDPSNPDNTSEFEKKLDEFLLEYLTTLQRELQTQPTEEIRRTPAMTLSDAKKDVPYIVLFAAKYFLVVVATVLKEHPALPGEIGSDGKLKVNSDLTLTVARYMRNVDWLLRNTVSEEFYSSLGAAK